MYSWGDPTSDGTNPGFLGRKTSDKPFNVKELGNKGFQTTRNDEPGQVEILPGIKVKRIEVKDGRFVAYLNLKYMHFDEKKHTKLKPNSLIKRRA